MKKIISLKIFIALIFFLNLNRCTKNNDQIDYSNVEGYYQYILIDHSNKTIIDTIRTYVNILGKINDSDSLKLHISLLPKNNFIGTINNYLEIRNLKFWGNKFTYEANRYYSTTLKKNEIWDVRDSSFSTTEKPYISFKCLSTDTTLIYPSGRKISNIRMVLKKVRHKV